MSRYTKSQYNSAYNEAPKPIKDAMFADETANSIKKIAARYNVPDKGFDIAADVGYALVGLVPVKKFPKILEEDAGLDAKTAKNVAHDIRAEIFAPVAQELAAMQEEAEKNYEEALKNPPVRSEVEQAPAKEKASDEAQAVPVSEEPQIEYVPKKKEGGEVKPDESVVREHKPPTPKAPEAPNQKPPTPPEPKKEKPVPAPPPPLKEETKKPPAEPSEQKDPEENNNDQELIDEIFPPAPGNGDDQENKNPGTPPPNLPGTQNSAEETPKRNFPPIPDTHRVDLRNNDNQF